MNRMAIAFIAGFIFMPLALAVGDAAEIVKVLV
jgi:hypothetical protein